MISVPDEAYLGKASVLSGACIVCGQPATDKHHQPPRSHVPKGRLEEVPLYSLCGPGNAGGCHGLAHRVGGTLVLRPTDDPRFCWAVADERAADAINKRRRLSGLPKVKPHVDFMCRASGEPGADVGEVLDDKRRDIDEAQRLDGTLSWAIGDALREAWEVLAGTLPASEAREQYRAFLDSLEHPLSQAQASRLRIFASLRSERARELPAYKGYYAAKAVIDGLLAEDEAVELAHRLSLADFRREVWCDPEEKEPDPPCPLDGRPCRRARKEEGHADDDVQD